VKDAPPDDCPDVLPADHFHTRAKERPMKLKRSRGYRRGRIEIIPMIDVMFFLLVTFMLASLSMQSLNSLRVDLPQGDAPSLQHHEPVTLTITKDSHIFLDKTPATLDDMAFKLKAMLTTPDKGVVVNADGAAPEGIVVQAMLQARRAGVEHFLIAVRRQ
jgi:biopolymer transport protein ExbD